MTEKRMTAISKKCEAYVDRAKASDAVDEKIVPTGPVGELAAAVDHLMAALESELYEREEQEKILRIAEMIVDLGIEEG